MRVTLDELLGICARSPDDPAPVAVLTDWLLDAGHPLGPVLGAALAGSTEADALRDAYLAERGLVDIGDLTFRHGLVERVRLFREDPALTTRILRDPLFRLVRWLGFQSRDLFRTDLCVHLDDLEVVAELPALTCLQIAEQAVEDLSPLARCAGLRALGLTRVPLRQLPPLRLRYLSLRATALRSLDVLDALPDLVGLNVARVQADLGPVRRRAGLRYLDVNQTGLDTAELASRPDLRALNIAATQVRDVAPLADCANLRELVVSSAPIDDLTPLLALPQLECVEAFGRLPASAIAAISRLPSRRFVVLCAEYLHSEPERELAWLRRPLSHEEEMWRWVS